MAIPLPAPHDAPWLAPALWLVARGTLLLVCAALLAAALRHRSAAARHLVWALSLVALLALPALTLAVPRWELSFISIPSMDPSGAAASMAGAAGPAYAWGTIALALWAAGALVVLGRLALARLGVRRLARDARPVTTGEWMERMRAAARELGIRPHVRLLRAPGATMPMTWGVLRPVILLPAAADEWAPERKRVVLLHEMAHVARRDCLWQMLAGLCCAAYWFHPGAWWAARRMREEREQACDDRVLALGTRASDYAGHLLEVARAFRPGPLPVAAAVAMAARSQLEERVIAVLDGARARGAVGARAAVLCGGVAAVALFPLAAASPSMHVNERPAMAAPAVALAPPTASVPEPASARRNGRREDRRADRATRRPPRVPAHASRMPAARSAPEPEIAPELLVGDEATIAALTSAARSADPSVRRSAVWALGQIDDGLVVPALVRSMSDRDARVRGTAALALGEYQQRRRACEADCPPAPGGSARGGIRPPRTARAAPDPGDDTGLRILSGLNGDTLTLAGSPETPIPQTDM